LHLLLILKRYHQGRSKFIVANAMAGKIGWTLDRFRKARNRLEELGRFAACTLEVAGRAIRPYIAGL
jgi:hypothetical protein